MNADYIARALCFHGQPMQKIWEDERGAGDLQIVGVPLQANYAVYQERQKHFTFQDRAKRLKLHQFFARKANDLYDAELKNASSRVMSDDHWDKVKTHIAVMPPYELFFKKNQDKIKRVRAVLEGIKPGDVVYGVIAKATGTMMVKPLCTAEPLVRYLSDITTKAFVHPANMSSTMQVTDKRGKQRSFLPNDFVCCEVLEISVDADRLYLGMEGVLTKDKNIKLGLVSPEDLPAYYRKANDNALEKYDECLRKSKEMLNPNYDMLFDMNGLDVNDTFTLMSSLKYSFPVQEFAKELRQAQASKWAFRSVAEGIEHFKIGHHVEAFQCLNKALNIDPRNVEGLVARGALYANKGSFLKAVEDFEKALKLNSFHVNARKYMGETLVALGRSYEEENRMKEAVKAYMDCLNIIPNHEQARLSLEAIQQRSGAHLFESLLSLPGAAVETEKQRKKKRTTSSSSSSDESTTNNSSSSSDNDSTDSRQLKKEPSLSPLSKRMALHAATLEANEACSQFNQPFYMASYNATPEVLATVPAAPNAHDFRLDDDDTETRVRKLLQEASKHKKEKTKKSKKKKSKKSKKDSVKAKEATATLLEAYKAISSSLNIKSQLKQNLQTYEETIVEIKKRQEFLQQSASIGASSSSNNTAPLQQKHERSESPPPKPPSMRMDDASELPSTSRATAATAAYAFSGVNTAATANLSRNEPAPKLSFQIKRPVKVDKFGLMRIATPLAQKSPTPTRASRSRSRSNSHSSRRRRRTSRRSTSRSPSYHRSSSRRRNFRDSYRRSSRSYSRSPRSHSRYSNRSRENRDYNRRRRRRTPSPFVPRDTPPRRSRHSKDRRSRSTEYRSNGSPSKRGVGQQFGNRVWQRPGYVPPIVTTAENSKKPSNSDGRWLHDKFEDKSDDGPSIEEIDEIINKAQKERKQEIIKRDKDILKKPTGDNF